MKMSSDTNFTVTSWFLRNVHIKPYFNTQCGCLVPQPPHCATPIVFQLFLSNQTETHSEAVAVAAIQLLTHHAKKKFATFLIYHQPSMISYDEARCFHFRFSFFLQNFLKKIFMISVNLQNCHYFSSHKSLWISSKVFKRQLHEERK